MVRMAPPLPVSPVTRFEGIARSWEWAIRRPDGKIEVRRPNLVTVRAEGQEDLVAPILAMGTPGRSESFDAAMADLLPRRKGVDVAVFVGGLLVILVTEGELLAMVEEMATMDVLRE